MPQPLNRQTAQIQNTYPERIVQFGGGNFLRAFVDWIVEVLNEETDFASSVVIVKPTPSGAYERLAAQDGLFHVRLHGLQDGQLVTRQKLITCVNRAVNPYHDYATYLSLARQPDARFVVSNTTEAGIVFAPEDRLDDGPPSSFPAKLAAFLYERYQHFQGDAQKGCIILPCELIEGNGDQLREMILRYADLWGLGAGFKAWIDSHNQFCNTLVDRIVTGFPGEDSEAILRDLGFDDQLLAEGEQYHNWVIEGPDWIGDEFPAHQADLNVSIVDDLTPHREMKVRILNGLHTAMVPIGYFLGLETVRQAIEHPLLGRYLEALAFEEIIPTLDVPKAAVTRFAEDVLARFHNPFLHHRLLTIALHSLAKFKTRLLPSLLTYTSDQGRLPGRIVFAFAALIRFYQGAWNDTVIPLNDDPVLIAWFEEQWQIERSLPEFVVAVLQNQAIWGVDLSEVNGLVDEVARYLKMMQTDGVEQIIENENWAI